MTIQRDQGLYSYQHTATQPAADGWKCAICGAAAREHDPGHLHVGSDRYSTLRCAACGRADVHCGCV